MVSLDESRICECLCYLIDLCLVISRCNPMNLGQIKQVGQAALELIHHWRKVVNAQVLGDGKDNSNDIQNELRERYPTSFGVKKAFRGPTAQSMMMGQQ